MPPPSQATWPSRLEPGACLAADQYALTTQLHLCRAASGPQLVLATLVIRTWQFAAPRIVSLVILGTTLIGVGRLGAG